MKGKKLTVAFVRKAPAGKHHDGVHGLFLRVTPSGSRQWVTRITVHGVRRDYGLGGFPLVSLAEARDKAFTLRRVARQGGDPATVRGGRSVPTFETAAERTIELNRPTWRGDRTEAQWRATLRRYAMPVLGKLPVDTIGTGDVLRVLAPIWSAKPAIAHQLRVRIGSVLKWAIGAGYRTDNPAGEAVMASLPKRNGGTRHLRAAAHADMPDVLAKVDGFNVWKGTRLALRFIAYTATRANEVRGARWSEIDMDAKVWTIPADRMKAGREHRVPLSRQALAILDEAHELARGDIEPAGMVFPSARGKTIASAVMLRVLTETDAGTTTHGMRSSFRSWCADRGESRELAEAALAHAAGVVEASYQRSDLAELRRDLMQRWADHVAPVPE